MYIGIPELNNECRVPLDRADPSMTGDAGTTSFRPDV
jgi:hypothetical protein